MLRVEIYSCVITYLKPEAVDHTSSARNVLDQSASSPSPTQDLTTCGESCHTSQPAGSTQRQGYLTHGNTSIFALIKPSVLSTTGLSEAQLSSAQISSLQELKLDPQISADKVSQTN
ncbi:hypothetical protein PoB_001689700 [Plakobranchus ocellatus]|uniref:Uncharacterized protein n=1 Tax=Plakobranchus ocellatus TaxID=259542 RepID=A0AAV3Z563_9GAST|nr:hypothetical protein PoB_001689700 [Plakobranchus ocellatus]